VNTLPKIARWEFEAADPEVGIMTDDVVHGCERNEDGESAVITDVRLYANADGTLINEQTTFECPECSATTTTVDQFPAWMFQEPGR
jgi:hypothetical protein